MYKNNKNEWIEGIKDLYIKEQIELVGTGAYHPLLTKLPYELADMQIKLQEYALATIFGELKISISEDAPCIKDLIGFFPPELGINLDLLNHLDHLNYEWTMCDETAVINQMSTDDNQNTFEQVSYKTFAGVYKINNIKTNIIVRNTYLSNKVSFKRDNDELNIINNLTTNKNIIVLDGETFGHHNAQGINLLKNIYLNLKKSSSNIQKISEYISDIHINNINTINESTWSSIIKDNKIINSYAMWDIKNNNLQHKIWKLYNNVSVWLNKYYKANYNTLTFDIIQVLHINNTSYPYSDESVNNTTNLLTSMKCLSSDNFWWLSDVEIMSKYTYDTQFVLRGLKIFEILFTNFSDLKKEQHIVDLYTEIITNINLSMSK